MSRLIAAMDKANTTKEKAKALANELKVEKQLMVQKDEQLQAANQKVKPMVAKAVQAFQLTKEYNTVLFTKASSSLGGKSSLWSQLGGIRLRGSGQRNGGRRGYPSCCCFRKECSRGQHLILGMLLLMQLDGTRLQLEALFSFVFVIYFSSFFCGA